MNIESKVNNLFRNMCIKALALTFSVLTAANAFAGPIFFNKNNELWKINEDRTGEELVYSKPNHKASAPTVSPTGRYVAFQMEKVGDENSRDIYLLDMVTKDEFNLTKGHNPNGSDSYPDFHPLGDRIVYSANIKGNADIYVIPLYISLSGDFIYAGEPKRMTTNPGHDTTPAYSPKGDKILYARSDNKATDTLDIYLMSVDEPFQVMITKTKIREWFPDWSKDGNYFMYQQDFADLDWKRIFIYNITLGRYLVVPYSTDVGQKYAQHPKFSADNKAIVFSLGEKNDPNSYEIMKLPVNLEKYKAEFGELVQVTKNSEADMYPVMK